MNKLIITVLLSIFWFYTKAQEDTTAQNIPALNDSINSNSAEQVVDLINKSDSLTLTDSINVVVLERRLDELRSYEKSKRRELEKQLAQIRSEDSLRRVRMKADIDLLKKNAVGYPVIIEDDTVITIYTKIGSLTPYERAKLVRERLTNLYQVYFLNSDSLNLVETGPTIDIFFNDKIILSVTDLDALWFNRDKSEIALDYRSRILADIATYKRNHSILKYVKEFGTAALVILFQVLLIVAINYFFRARVTKILWAKRGVWFKGIKFRGQEVINESHEASAVIFITKLFRYAIILFLLYLTLPTVFLIFPLTERFATVLFGYVITPLKSIGSALVNYLPDLITIIVIVTITRYLLLFLKFLSNEILEEKLKIPGFYADWAKPTYNIIKILIMAFMFVVIFPYLPGSDSSIFKGVSVFLGLVFSLGSTSIIGNLMAGLVITYMRPFRKGDQIKVGDVIGNVVEKTPFVTRIRTPKKEYITIPNSNILSGNVVNYSNSELQGGLILHTKVTIGYDVPWRQVHQILIGAAKITGNLNLEIAPFVLQTSLDDFYVSYQLNVHTNEPSKMPGIYNELHQNIQDGFREANIEILSPHYRAERDGNPLTVPKEIEIQEDKKK